MNFLLFLISFGKLVFFVFFEKYSELTICFFDVEKRIISKTRSPLIIKLFILSTKLCFSPLKNEHVLRSIQNCVKNMTHSVIRTRHLCLPNHGNTSHICIIQDTNVPADDSMRHGQNQENEQRPTTELNVFTTKKKFDRKQKQSKLASICRKNAK